MDIRAQTLTIPKTARYYMLGRPGPETRQFWMVCHGYGQLAARFIQKFSDIAGPDTLIVAPEGLSRFYLDGLAGDVGASWMTRENRLDEIADYTLFLQTLYEQFIGQLPQEVTVVMLGFSQGCATQMRWLTRYLPRFDHLILWAGGIPEDIDYLEHRDYFAGKSMYYIYGTEDPFLTPERVNEYRQLTTGQQLHFQERTFSGKHSVDRDALKSLAGEMGLR